MSGSKTIIEINDPEVNVEEIMSRILEQLRVRRTHAAAQGLDYDSLVNIEFRLLEGKRLTREIYEELSRLVLVSDELLVQLAVHPRRMPLVSRIFFRFETLMHKLVVKYVNMLAGRQIVFNRRVIQTLISMTRELEHVVMRIETLETRIAELEQRMSGLEK